MTETSWELHQSLSLSFSLSLYLSLSFSLFPTRTDRSQIHNNRLYFNTTFCWYTRLTLNKQPFYCLMLPLIFALSLSLFEYALLLLPLLLCCIVRGDFLLFFFFFLSSILQRRRNAFLGAVSDTAWDSSFTFII